MRQRIVAGNWKMNGTREGVVKLLRDIIENAETIQTVKLIVFPPFVFLESTQALLSKTLIEWGAQTVSEYKEGAYTGEVSASMLSDFGCEYVLVGHSERRTLYGETDECVAAKFKRSIESHLKPILCVGETQEQRELHQTESVIIKQLSVVFDSFNESDAWKETVIAYEPVWAIGTGLTATPEQAQEIHALIRAHIAKYDKTVAAKMPILYGGSVKANNAKAIFQMPDIDGGLIGGASLHAREFLEIARLCNS